MGLIIIITCIVFVLGIIYYQKKGKQQKEVSLLQKIRCEWNETKEVVLKEEELKFLRFNYAYQSDNEENNVIDDLTWNNLELDGIFAKIEHTKSTMGQVYLYKILRNPVFDINKLKMRNRIIEIFRKDSLLRESILMKLSKIGKNGNISFYEYLDSVEEFIIPSVKLHIVMLVLLVVTGISFLLSVRIGSILIVPVFLLNLVVYLRDKASCIL